MRFFPVWVAALAAVCSTAFADSDFSAACADLGKTTRQHPYLLFTAEDKPAMLQQIAGNQKESELYQKLLLEGERYLHATVEHYDPPARVPHARYTGDDPLLTWMGEQQRVALTLAFLYQMTGDPKYVQKAFEHADAVCDLESWVQSAHHFNNIYTRTWPYGPPDDIVVFSYDITAAGVSRDMAFVYDWLYSGLTKAQRDRIRGALLEKAITRVRGSWDYFWWANAVKCNWTGICHSGVGLATLAILNENPELAPDVLSRCTMGVSRLLDHMGDDGSWQEGRGYWAYGLGESTFFIEAMKRVSGGKIDLYKHGNTFTHPLDFALYGLTAGFGDGSGTPVGNSFFVNRLVDVSRDPAGAWYRDTYVRDDETIWDLVWPKSDVQPVKPTEASHLFKPIDWAVLRKDFSPDSLTLATKAGMNDDPHHGHMDCGTFNLTWQGVNFIGEIARTPYDDQYFGALRWEHLEAATAGHNVVMVNDENQICAKLKDQPWQSGIGGHIVGYDSQADWGYVVMDPTHAYPDKELKSWHRWIALDKAHNIAVVLDRVGAAPGSNIQVLFHSAVAADTKDGIVMIHGAQGSDGAQPGGRGGRRQAAAAAQRATQHAFYNPEAGREGAGRPHTDMAMVPLSPTPFTVIQGRQADVPITEEDNSVWVPYFATRLKATSETTWVGSVFICDPERNSPRDLNPVLDTTGASPTLRYTIDGKTVSYSFADTAIARVAQ